MTKLAGAGLLWRTWLGRSLLAWMALSLLLTLAWGRLAELSPQLVAPALAVIILAPVVPLLVWAGWASARQPRILWPIPLIHLVFCAAFAFGFEGLMRAGAYLNFLSHRDAYERIVAERKAGLLPLGGQDWQEGLRHGVKYALGQVNSGEIDVLFDWGNPHGFSGVIYSEQECSPAADQTSKPISAASQMGPVAPDEATPPTMKNAGRVGGPWWRLEGYYCFVIIQM